PKGAPNSRFRSVEDTTIAFQRFGQRADTCLLDALSLAARPPPQSLLKEEPLVVHVGEIVIGCEGGGEASLATMSSRGSLARHERTDHPGYRTEVALKLLEHRPLVGRAMSSVRCMGFWASLQAHSPRRLPRHWRSTRRTLGSAGELMVSSLQRKDVCRDHRVQECGFPRSTDPAGDFRHRFCESGLARRSDARRDRTERGLSARAPCEVLFEFAVAPEPLRKAFPTRRLPRDEHWPDPCLDPDGLHQKPSLAVGE